MLPGKIPLTCLAVMMLLLAATSGLAQDRFTDNGDGTVTDHKLNLMWSKTDNNGNIDWKQAMRWVKYTFPDTLEKKYDNWRLPTLEEMKSLYIQGAGHNGYESDCGQQVKIVPEIHISCGWLWTSKVESITAMVFNFQRGIYHTDRMVHSRAYRALPVRDLK
ncbi:MAG: hypothetical protein DSY90_13585 [Deltaproteobacteria bacterium]|nr:MAG: hypothetical protein DSY90_13585 [Deltaproteobacteria bacterium]